MKIISSKVSNEKGIAFLASILGIMVILLMFSSNLFLHSTNESQAVRHDIASLQSFYSALAGIDNVYYELKNSAPDTKNWYTHTVGAKAVLSRSNGSSLQARLSSVSEITAEGYASKAGQPFSYVCKIYNDPSVSGGSPPKIVLCKGTSSSDQRLVAAKLRLNSLYEYFMFFPEQDFRPIAWLSYNAQGGKIHTNKNIILTGPAITNISELSAAGKITYLRSGFFPPLVDLNNSTGMQVDPVTKTTKAQIWNPGQANNGTYDGRTWAQVFAAAVGIGTTWQQGLCSNASSQVNCWVDNITKNNNPLIQAYNNDKYLADWHYWNQGLSVGDYGGPVCQKKNTSTKTNCANLNNPNGSNPYVQNSSQFNDWILLDSSNPVNGNSYMYQNYGSSSNFVSPTTVTPAGSNTAVAIPNRLNTTWRWPKYMTDGNVRSDDGYSSGGTWSCINNSCNKYAYPPAGTYTASDVQGTCPDQYCSNVNFLNTEYQADDWANFLQTSGSALNGIVREKNTGGTYVTPPTVDASNYRTVATTKGIYIQNTMDPATFNGYYGTNGSNWTPAGYVNTYFRDKTQFHKNDYTVKIGNQTLTPNTDGVVNMNIAGLGNVPVFEKKGFYNDRSALWDQMVKVNVVNLKAAMDQGLIVLQSNILYSDWGLGIDKAQAIPTSGMTFVTEGASFGIGDINTSGFAPTAVITKGKFYELSSGFDFPQAIPDLAMHPDAGNPNYAPADVNRQWQNDHNAQMPHKVDKSYTYNISVIGETASDQGTLENSYLELWGWKDNWLTVDPGAGVHAYDRKVTGTLLLLPQGSFTTRYNYGSDGYAARWCNADCTGTNHNSWGWPSCRGCSQYCPAGGCVGNAPYTAYATNIWPNGGFGAQWESRYADGTVPPGDLGGLTTEGFIFLTNSTADFNNSCKALEGNQ